MFSESHQQNRKSSYSRLHAAHSSQNPLSHWTKAGTDPDAEYLFAKYNVQPTSYVYSQDEYTRFLEDKDWTKEETDYLFELVREYDSRFYIVHDRYEFSGGPQRSLEVAQGSVDAAVPFMQAEVIVKTIKGRGGRVEYII